MSHEVRRNLIAGGIVLGIGVGAMLILISLRKPPAEATAPKERSIRVTAIEAQPEDLTVTIAGYGEARPRRTVEVAPEVSGSVLRVHPNLVVGGFVREGEVIFELDAGTYRTELDEAQARIDRHEASLKLLEVEYTNDQERLKTLQRSRVLAQAKYDRAVKLFKQSIGNQTDIDEAEQASNDVSDRVDLLARIIAAYPLRIQETRFEMAADEARRDRSAINLSHTQITAPFDGRVTEYSVEKGHFASRGVAAVTLADDSSLEIPVKLEASDVRDWLRFNGHEPVGGAAWFNDLTQVVCSVRWTEDDRAPSWEGTLSRVERFEPASRTLTVVVRVDAKNVSLDSRGTLPLVAGMFCEVGIPGRTLESVYAVPQWAVTVDNTIFLSKENRLHSAAVEVHRIEGDTVYISGAVEPNDLIVTTRLINPLDNTLLEIDLGASGARPETE